MAQKIRVGVMGATWGERAHAPVVRALPEYELVAACTAHEDTAQAMAERIDAPKAYGNLDKMLQDPEIDAITVAVRPALHAPTSIAAMLAGKHVYCEWPTALNVEQAQELVSLSKETGRQAVIGVQAHWSPVIILFQRLLQEGYVGDVWNFAFTQFMSQYQRPTPSARWWTMIEEEGGSSLALQGGAVFHLVDRLLGDVAELAATANVQQKRLTWSDTGETIDVTSPDSIAVALRMRSGAIGTATISRVAWHGSGQRLEVYGSKGSLQLTRVDVPGGRRRQGLLGALGEERLAEIPIPDDAYFVDEVSRDDPTAYPLAQNFRRFAEAINSGESVEPNFSTGLRVHRVLAAIKQSSDQGRWVPIVKD